MDIAALLDFRVIVIISVTLILGLVAAFFILRSRGSSRTRDIDVLFLGPVGGGKTVLSHLLCDGEIPDTITSMKPATMTLLNRKSKSAVVVDFPGHPRLRSQISDSVKRAKKIIFVIDSTKVQTQIREAAEFLYDIFTNPAMDNGPPMLIACNKSDVQGARPPARVKLALQQEIEKIRKTRQSLEVVGYSDVIRLGRDGVEFSIERDSPVELSFSATSAKARTIDSINDFIG